MFFRSVLTSGADATDVDSDVIVKGTSTSDIDGGAMGLLVTTKGAGVQVSDLGEVRGGGAAAPDPGSDG